MFPLICREGVYCLKSLWVSFKCRLVFIFFITNLNILNWYFQKQLSWSIVPLLIIGEPAMGKITLPVASKICEFDLPPYTLSHHDIKMSLKSSKFIIRYPKNFIFTCEPVHWFSACFADMEPLDQALISYPLLLSPFNSFKIDVYALCDFTQNCANKSSINC